MSSQESVEIKVVERKPGKGISRSLRTSKMVPAVVYGPKTTNTVFSFSEVEADKYSKRKYDNIIFTLKSDHPQLNNLRVLRKDYDLHPVTRRPIHFDFYAIDMTKKVTVSVELRFEGKAAGVAEGGLINIIRRNIEIHCLPSDIPEAITVDVSNLGLDQSLHVSDLKVPEHLEVFTEEKETIVTCAIVKEETVAPVEAAAADAAGAATNAATSPSAPTAPGEKKS